MSRNSNRAAQAGKKQSPRYTYNQGLGIGAALAMVTLSSEPSQKTTHLAEAQAMADYLVRHETREDVLLAMRVGDLTGETSS